VEWVRAWAPHAVERLIEIAKVSHPWIVEVARQRPMNILHPYMVEVYVARDGLEACLSLTSSKAFAPKTA
jgi:hypothetical protein